MKTPREILFQRHHSAEPKLDEIRKTAVVTICDRRVHSPVAIDRCYNWHDFIFSLRWHLAGMGAVWLVIILLNLNVGHSTSLASLVPGGKIPPPQIILASLRENRRELLKMVQPLETGETRSKIFPSGPRSERLPETLTA